MYEKQRKIQNDEGIYKILRRYKQKLVLKVFIRECQLSFLIKSSYQNKTKQYIDRYILTSEHCFLCSSDLTKQNWHAKYQCMAV